MNEVINILIVDDHKVIREGLKTLLSSQKYFNTILEAENGKEALKILKTTNINIVLTDLKMPEMSGIELVENIKKDFEDIKILVLTTFDDIGFIKSIIKVEAEGYLLKNSDGQEILKAINHITNGGTYYAQEIIPIIIKLHNEKKGDNNAAQNLLIKELTTKELEVLKLLYKGLSSKDIATKLFLSKDSIDSYRKKLLKKLNVNNTVGLIKFVVENNLFS